MPTERWMPFVSFILSFFFPEGAGEMHAILLKKKTDQLQNQKRKRKYHTSLNKPQTMCTMEKTKKRPNRALNWRLKPCFQVYQKQNRIQKCCIIIVVSARERTLCLLNEPPSFLLLSSLIYIGMKCRVMVIQILLSLTMTCFKKFDRFFQLS